MKYAAILFDFDGVLLESEHAGNKQIAEYLTAIGHPTSMQEAMTKFMGLAGHDFVAAIESHIGRTLPESFHDARQEEDRRALADGLDAVAGAIAFVRGLAPEWPRAIVSSSRTHWIATHLSHLGIRDAFPAIFSGREHVARGKPAPDLYLHAAQALGVDIGRTVILEDSPVGVTGAVASGAHVIGLCAGLHCPPDHGHKLRALGAHEIAHGFDQVAELIA